MLWDVEGICKREVHGGQGAGQVGGGCGGLENVGEDDDACELCGCGCEGFGCGDLLMEQLDKFLCPARSLPACFIYRMGAKSEAIREICLALVKGAPVLVTYQRSETAVISETWRISGSRLEMVSEGSM